MKQRLNLILWILIAIFATGILFSKMILPESDWLKYVFLGGILLCVGMIVRENRIKISKRTATQGANSLLTIILVFGIVALVNFLSFRNPYKFDLTKNKLNTFSEQSKKILSEIDQEILFTFFYSQPGELEKNRPMFEDYRALNPKLKIEYLQIDKYLTRAKAAGLKSPTTLIIKLGEREKRIETLEEEQITNALINLRKTSKRIICVTVGHGEADFSEAKGDGFSSMKTALESEAFQTKDWKTAVEKDPPSDCHIVAVLGPKKPFFKPELDSLEKFIQNGGKTIIALDLNLRGNEPSPGLKKLLKKYFIDIKHLLIIDPNPLNKMMGQSAALSLVSTFSKDSSMTKVFTNQSGRIRNLAHFPFSQALMIIPKPPSSLKVTWLAQTMATSWAESNMKAISQGHAQFNAGKDTKGPLTVAMSVEGTLNEKAENSKKMRLLVLGTSLFANNQFSRYGVNSDFFINAFNWIAGDENFITIRKKKDEPGKIELNTEAGRIIFWIAVVIIPLLVAIAGIVIWMRRKKL